MAATTASMFDDMTPKAASPVSEVRRRTLMERQSDKKSDGGEAFRMSERIIKNTQAMTDSLRAQRGKCQSSINKDKEDLQQVERTLLEYEKGYKVVVKTHAERVLERDALRVILAKSKTNANTLITTCDNWRAKNRRDTHRASRMIATSTLRAARGFSCDSGTTCTAAEARKRGRRMNSAASKTSIMGLTRPSTAFDTMSAMSGSGSAATLPNNFGSSRPSTSANDSTGGLSGVKSSYL